LPKEGAWLCNVSQGGSSVPSELEPEEFEIVNRLNPVLKSHGIIIYGVDTLVNDEGHRVLSELNTTSIGGIKQIEEYTGTPVLQDTADRIIQYAIRRKHERYKLSA
ncbi:MAG: hypothetical protein KDC44_18245, partial [Phaeodactylibacter sp.]|nr:hypothetical protein [Phaeodactylibacter sp.]